MDGLIRSMNISGKERYILSIIFLMLCCSCMPHSITFRKYAHRYIGQSLSTVQTDSGSEKSALKQMNG